jgi:ATP-dependent DNA ligase
MSARKHSASAVDRVAEGAVSSDKLAGGFPTLKLPLPVPFAPMEAKLTETIPDEPGWQYEPKWDGFRCLAFRDGEQIALQSKAGQPLARYFPELVAALLQLKPKRFVIDGEIVIARDGELSFDDLLMRIHPAQSRIQKLAKETPCTFLLFDLLVDAEGQSLIGMSLRERRARLESFYSHLGKQHLLKLSPATEDVALARQWMKDLSGSGLDGVVAKQLDQPYLSGERAMRKVKSIRSADCVVGGFRYASKGGEVGSLLLGLYNDEGLLDHVGFTSSFTQVQRKELKRILKPYMGGEGFSGRAPGGPSRWSTERSGQWERLQPKLVVEVTYDHFSGGRFRHGTRFLRWRPEKRAESCTFEQLSGKRKSKNSIHDLLAA